MYLFCLNICITKIRRKTGFKHIYIVKQIMYHKFRLHSKVKVIFRNTLISFKMTS